MKYSYKSRHRFMVLVAKLKGWMRIQQLRGCKLERRDDARQNVLRIHRLEGSADQADVDVDSDIDINTSMDIHIDADI